MAESGMACLNGNHDACQFIRCGCACHKPAEAPRAPELEPGQQWLMNSRLRGDGGDPTMEQRMLTFAEARQMALRVLTDTETRRATFSESEYPAECPGPRLAELEAENIRLEGDLEKVEGCLKKAHERIRAERAKLTELLAAVREAADFLNGEGYAPPRFVRLRAAVAAFEEGK